MPKGPKRRGGKATLGARLTRSRLDIGLTQHALAERVGTSQAVIQRIETGKCKHPRILDELAQALEVDAAWLMFGVKTLSRAELEPDAIRVAQAWSALDEADRLYFKRLIMGDSVQSNAA